MKIGILRETKIPADTRVPLTPVQCRALEDEFPDMKVYVQPSAIRCFKDDLYEKEGIVIREDLDNCDLLLGIKEVSVDCLLEDKTYLFFSHTIKKQEHNKKLLKTILDKRIRLIDYELLTDMKGIRMIGFGRWAGLLGTYLGLRALLIKKNAGILPLPDRMQTLDEIIKAALQITLPPFRMAITGDGRVAGGAEEMLSALGIRKITLDDYLSGMVHNFPVYVQLDPGKYNRSKNGSLFELQHFFAFPADYESNFLRFCDKTDLLIMAAYWDPAAPLLFTLEQLKQDHFKISVIADITCDLHGSIPCTVKTTTLLNPYYDYIRDTGLTDEPFSSPHNITMMAVDNLPTGLPWEASTDFGNYLIRNILPLFFNDPEHILGRATIAWRGKLTENFNYLGDWVNSPY